MGQVGLALFLKIEAGTPFIPWTATLFGAAIVVFIGGAIALAWPSRIPAPASGRATTPLDAKHDLTLVTVALSLEILAFILLDSAFDLRVGLPVLAIFLIWIAIWIPRRSRQIDVTTSIDVKRPPQVAFDFVSNPTNGHLYIPGVEIPEPIALPLDVGTVVHVRRRRADGRTFEWDERIVDYQPGQSFTTVALDDRASTGEVGFRAIDGGTRITFRYRSFTRLQTALLGGVLKRPSISEVLAANRTEWNQNLKAVLEASDLETV